MKVIFETPRLFLRQFTESDLNLIYKLNSDPEIIKYVHEAFLKNKEQAKKILSDIILPQYKLSLGRWATHKKDDYEFIGWCGLKYIEETGIIDLGYRFIKSEWGNGYATEAAQYTLIYGLRDLKLKTITAMAHIENVASLKVLEKIGMKYLHNDIVDANPVEIYTLSLSASGDFC